MLPETTKNKNVLPSTRKLHLKVVGITKKFGWGALADQEMVVVNSLSASLLLNIFLSFEVGIAHAIANFK